MKRLLPLIFAVLLLVSCQENGEPVIQEEATEELVWEFSYTIDGVEYTGNSVNGNGTGVLQAYYVSHKPTFEEYDSLFFMVSTTMRERSGDGSLKVILGKKYLKEQLKIRTGNHYTLYEEDRRDFIQEGMYPFSFDYDRHNSQDGVALELAMLDENEHRHILTTHSTAPYGFETLVNDDAQADSSFEILKVGTTPNGNTYIEAKFEATVFGFEGNGVKTSIQREVTNGFVRMPISYMDY
ncbi:hypothetical protein KI659_05455 [Litoribacter alkaliphilus]|uniref:Lipoprotein n=1 Tax=Litoribacter ruber TaxID=702568 RepID=A0AAP2G4H7_9BACT|nr:hypothetical protein [Litoribacter alkaliphilus]MBS9523463.1 hypothetical protein [Litoribacter alkaliphilus]